MAYRTTTALVREVLGDNYGAAVDSCGGCATGPSLTPYIATASALVDQMVTCAAAKGITYSETKLELIERWLAGHCYLQMDPAYSQLKTSRSAGKFTGETGKGLESSRYGDMALSLDHSGCLMGILKGARASAFWAGTAERTRRTYQERNF